MLLKHHRMGAAGGEQSEHPPLHRMGAAGGEQSEHPPLKKMKYYSRKGLFNKT